MKYAVYVKFRRTDNGGDQWSGNQDRTDESREVAERATVENLKKHFPIERVLKVISFSYADDEEAPSFCEETERSDKEDRKEFALVEIADAIKRLPALAEPPRPYSRQKYWMAIALVSQTTVLLMLIFRLIVALTN